jgi:hypothetical protein
LVVGHDGCISFTVRKNRMATAEAGFNIERARFVVHSWLKVLNKHAPTEDALRRKNGVDQVMVIGVDANARAPEHGAKGFKNFKDGEKFFSEYLVWAAVSLGLKQAKERLTCLVIALS